MAVKIQVTRFSIVTDFLSVEQWYAQSFGIVLPSTVKNNSDHHKWPDIIGI